MGAEWGEECTGGKDLGVISISVITEFMAGRSIPLDRVGQLAGEPQNLRARQQRRMLQESKE